jgi:hypothetical protein
VRDAIIKAVQRLKLRRTALLIAGTAIAYHLTGRTETGLN